MNRPYLSVVLTNYNEEKNLKSGTLDDLLTYLNKQKFSWEIIFVDDASTDETLSLLKDFAKRKPKQIRVFAEKHRGKGGGLMKGASEAEGEYVLFTDTDQATPINQLPKLLAEIGQFDIVIGSRSGREGAPLTRLAMAYGFVTLRYLILRLPFTDTQCGFKLLKTDVAKEIFDKMILFDVNKFDSSASVTAAFDLEMLYLARKLGYKVAEVPVDWKYKDTVRVSAIHDSLEALMGMLHVRLNSLRGLYK